MGGVAGSKDEEYPRENHKVTSIDILSLIINSKDFDFLFGLCLNKGFEIFEVLKYLVFFLEKANPCKTWEIIKTNEKKTRFFLSMDV